MKTQNVLAATIDTTTTKTLTVIVVDSNNERAQGAEVTLNPSGVKGVTDKNGEVVLKIGGAPKYDVLVNQNGNKITVPYYVTNGGASRLMVNPTYVKSVEAANAKVVPGWFRTDQGIVVGIVAILIIGFVLWKIFRKK